MVGLGDCSHLRVTLQPRHASVRLCGELRLQLGGMPVERELPARQGRLLFAFLVLHRGRAVRRDELIEALWPERPPRDPDAALSSVLARLRRVVGHERLPARGSVRLLLGPEAWVDVEAAEAAAPDARSALDGGQPDRALELASEALGIVDQPLLAEFEREWLDERRRALTDLVAPLVDVAAEAGVALGGAALDRAELLARRGVDREPFRESAHAALMRVLAAKGDSAEALLVYDALRVRLRDELGAAPSRALIVLYERLFTGEPARVAPADRARTDSPESAPAGYATVPAPPSALLGRGRDLDRLRVLLDAQDVRLVTVVGPGGVGKTRLAVELTRELVARGSEAAWVALAPVRAARDVAVTIARALSVTPAGDESAEAALARVLAARELVLVLDNFEHVSPAAALVAELLTGAPRLMVLVTSREPLRVRAERVFRLAPLELPPDDVGADELTASPGTALFLATALAHDPDLRLTGEDASAVAEICRRVDGLPLAIELAAGRLGVLSPRELAVQVRAGLEPLSLAPRDAPGRHRSLRDTLAWSHRLLAEEEQTAFARFAVFAGGADPGAAHAVTGADVGVFQALADKHLLTVAVDREGARRLDMLETVRRFALEHLDTKGNVERLAARHADYFLELAERAAPDLRRRGPLELFRKLDRELHNLRAAMAWALEHDRPEHCLRLAVALEQYWAMFGPDEAVRWLQAGLEGARHRLPAALLARALTALSGQLGVLGAGREAETRTR